MTSTVSNTQQSSNIGIYIYDDAEVLDFSGPFEVFSTASRLSEPSGLFNVILIAQNPGPVRARGGFSINPSHSIDNHPPLDVLVVAGGVHTAELQKTDVIRWIARISERTQLTASVCTGAFLLAEAGLLTGRSATTHWEDIPDLRTCYPDIQVLDNRRWVDENDVITSGGISAGIDMSLHLVSRLGGMTLAEMTAKQMEFDWRCDNDPDK
ncbi:DJ-1/PfpI family protein [Microbulbifer sp.]|uniref:DJ-1/PfpI family protein n=1 Tax=Microbulbifer sp. TaxID=1908541 RepID=UPI00258D01FE|nr:DJ-1/PfpI family protein [Microbulbifer sp.]